MYDAREKAIRDQQWHLNAAFRTGKNEGLLEGKLEGEINPDPHSSRVIAVFLPVSQESDLREMTLAELESMTSKLREQLRSRTGA